MNRLKTFMVILLTMVFCIEPFIVYAQEEKLPSGMNESELKNQINDYVNSNMETTDGMAYWVFRGTRDIASGYFGYADKENDIKVDENTVFEWGSVSKLMVWVSVMQMDEQGKIDLKKYTSLFA